MGDIVTIDEQVFTDIADAIRDRNGETATYKPREMAAAVGAAYSSVIYNTGNRIATLVDIPADKTVYVSINHGYKYAWFGFDSSGYTKSARTDMKTWHTVPLYRTSAGMTQIGLVVWKYDGTVLDPADWADSGITVSYAP